MAMVRPWCGHVMAMVRPWCGLGVAMVWPWCGRDVAIVGYFRRVRTLSSVSLLHYTLTTLSYLPGDKTSQSTRQGGRRIRYTRLLVGMKPHCSLALVDRVLDVGGSCGCVYHLGLREWCCFVWCTSKQITDSVFVGPSSS